MKVLITGADGFIAKNFIEHLRRDERIELYLYTKKDSMNILSAYIQEVDFIYHLAGVNRPKEVQEFYEGNSELTKYIVDTLEEYHKSTPILYSSSIQAIEDNDYGKSKREAENRLIEYAKKRDAHIFIYRLLNVFGKWSKPNYNSVIATWCHNIAHDKEIEVNNKTTLLNLIYIDDVIDDFLKKLEDKSRAYFYEIEKVYHKELGEIETLLYQFKKNRETLVIPNVASGFERALYATYLSYLPKEHFSYELKGHKDERGTFYEIVKTLESGQFSLSTTAPGVMRGNHYHHTKNEKFLVVKGQATIEFRHIVTDEIIRYQVSDAKMEVVEMIPGYTHNIKNTGSEEMILFLWANESFNLDNPDTYYLEV